jgi:hypothetical protein
MILKSEWHCLDFLLPTFRTQQDCLFHFFISLIRWLSSLLPAWPR